MLAPSSQFSAVEHWFSSVQCCQMYGFIRTNTDLSVQIRIFDTIRINVLYGISKNTNFFPFSHGFFIFSSIFTTFLGNFLWFLRTSQFYCGVKGVWCNSVTSMITKCCSDHRSDHNLLEWEYRFTLGLNAATNTDYIKKRFEQKLFRIKFSRKKLPVHIPQSPPEVELWGSQYRHFWNRK